MLDWFSNIWWLLYFEHNWVSDCFQDNWVSTNSSFVVLVYTANCSNCLINWFQVTHYKLFENCFQATHYKLFDALPGRAGQCILQQLTLHWYTTFSLTLRSTIPLGLLNPTLRSTIPLGLPPFIGWPFSHILALL